ncbi:integrase [Cupriavidus metallidurans]|jgi:integrase|uniref:hypothetical protein n=1 Tax=Cupriavidus TaxID=106589 RepID=UPI00049367A3|nr:hypothetical protein [Cupriavidus metallidurans]MDE4917481.1 hypothetical protein [Cupriavidus metallidurans]
MTQSSLSLTDLAARWAATYHPDAMTARQMRHVTQDLSALSDVSDPRELTPVHLGAFQADLLRHYPRPTARRMLGLAHALLQCGVSEALLATNPARGLTLCPSPVPALRPFFTPDDLTRIFSHRRFTAHALPSARDARGIAAYWLPLILLCTGARIEEAAALRTDDLCYRADTPPIPYWRFADRGAKTAAAQSPRPVHPILCRLGLLDYVASLPPGSDLFPLLIPGHTGRRAERFCRDFHRFLRQEVGLVEPNKTAHSFRHTFAHACRQAALPTNVIGALMGRIFVYESHEHEDREIPLAALQQAMARVTFPGFPL